MSDYRRAWHPGGTYFFTVNLLQRHGNVPAFDTNFKKGFKVSTFGPKALRKISAFYEENREVIERYRTPTLDFVTGETTPHKYTRAKVIDMAFFVEGMS